MRYPLIALILFYFLPSQGQQLILRSVDALEDKKVIEMAQLNTGEVVLMESKTISRFNGYESEFLCQLSQGPEQFETICVVESWIYIGTSNGQLLRLRDSALDTILEFKDSAINDIIMYQEGLLLIATDRDGIHILDVSDPELRKPVDQGDHLNGNVLLSCNHGYYVGTDHGLLYSKDPADGFEELSWIGPMIIQKLVAGRSGELWISEFDGTLWRINIHTRTKSKVEIALPLKINDMEFDIDRLFISTDRGVLQIISDDKGFISSTQVAAGSATSVFLDDESNLWIGRETSVDCSSLYFTKISLQEDDEIHSMSYITGKLFLGSDNSLIEWDAGSGDVRVIDEGHNITCMDHFESSLVIGTYDLGLLIYSEESIDAIKIGVNAGLTDNTILAVEFVGPDKILASTLNGIFSIERNQNTWTVSPTMREVAQFYVLSIVSMNDGSILLGTDKKGAIHYKGGELEIFNTSLAGNETGTIASFALDSTAAIWAISERSGLLKYSDSGFEEISSPHGSWDMYTSVVALESDRLLLIGENEVSIFDPRSEELIQFNDELNLERGTSFFNNFTRVGTYVYFEHNGSVYRFEDIITARTHSMTSLLGVDVDLEPIDTTRHRFNEEDNSFAFNFTGVLHRNPKQVRYSYRLIGHDDDWRFTRDRQVAYSHLEPGAYEFQVRSSHDLFQSDAVVSSYAFVIRRHFYNTLWFRTLVFLALIGVIYFLSRRRRKARELNDKLALLSTESKLLSLKSQLNPHFLFNSFNTVIGLIEEDPGRSINFVEKLTDFYRVVLEVGDSELIPLHKELEMLNSYVHLLSERFGEGLVVELPVDSDDSLIPPLSLQLLIENAVKHNVVIESDPLVISITYSSEAIVVTNQLNPRTSVKDSMGIGLENLKQRYEILSGKKLAVEIRKDSFIVTLPKIFAEKTD